MWSMFVEALVGIGVKGNGKYPAVCNGPRDDDVKYGDG